MVEKVISCHCTLARHSAMLVTDLSVSSLRCLDPEKPRTICRGHVGKCSAFALADRFALLRPDVPPACTARKPPTLGAMGQEASTHAIPRVEICSGRGQHAGRGQWDVEGNRV